MSMTPIDTWKAERELMGVEEAMGTASASLRRRLKETGRGTSRDELEQVADWLERQHTKLLQARTALGITGRCPESNPLHQELAVNFQEVVHSAPAVKADVAKRQ
jgi:hypothetical protein